MWIPIDPRVIPGLGAETRVLEVVKERTFGTVDATMELEGSPSEFVDTKPVGKFLRWPNVFKSIEVSYYAGFGYTEARPK